MTSRNRRASGGPITKDNTGVEVYDTIFSVVESPLQKDLIWAGTDDGLVQLTRDGGEHWENVTPKAMPDWGTVSMIEASSRDVGTAYLAVERHKSDDFTPYVFKTTDFGKTWTKLVAGLPANDYVHAVRVDPRRPRLLFAGTEQGMYFSFDDGAHWQPLQLNLPTVPVNDLVIKNTDLVVATHGRSFWVLDDITPLEQYEDSIPQQEAHLFTPAPASHTVFHGSGASGNVGKNPPAGAVIDYWLKVSLKKSDQAKPTASGAGTENAPAKSETSSSTSSSENKKTDAESEAPKITLEILDASGKVIRKYPKKEETGGDNNDEEDFFNRERRRGQSASRRGPEPLRMGPALRGSDESTKSAALGWQHKRSGSVARHLSSTVDGIRQELYRSV